MTNAIAITPGIGGIEQHLANTSLRMRWAMACWIKNGMTREIIQRWQAVTGQRAEQVAAVDLK